MATVYRVYEGRRFSPEMWTAVSEWRRLCRAEGIPFRITQGGFNNGAVAASGGTHDGDAVDLSVSGLTQAQVSRLITLGRMVGIAASFRTTRVSKWGTRAQGFGSYHVHGVPNGWGHPSRGAREQALAYRRGRDGLRQNGPDVGPGHVSTYRTRTWADYQKLTASKPSPTPTPTPAPIIDAVQAAAKETDMAITDKDAQKIAKAVANELLVENGVHRAGKLVPLIQEIADQGTTLTAINAKLDRAIKAAQ